MTPAINLAKKLKLTYKIHEYAHDSSASSYGLEAAEKLGVAAERVFKTLVVKTDNGQLIELSASELAAALKAQFTDIIDE